MAEQRRVTYSTRRLSAIMIVMDAIVVGLVGVVAHRIRFSNWDIGADYASLVMAAVIFLSLLSTASRSAGRDVSALSLVAQGSLAWLIVWTSLVVWLAAIGSTNTYSRLFLFGWGSGTLVAVCAARLLSGLLLQPLSKLRFNPRRVLVIGRGQVSTEIRRRVVRSRWSGYVISKVVDIDDMNLIRKLGEDARFNEIWISLGIERMNLMPNVLDALHQSTADVRVVLDLFTFRVASHGVSSVVGFPTVSVSATPMTGLNAIMKALEDYILAFLILVLISPLLIVIAIAVKATSNGPVFYKQRRHGWNGKIIWVYKFRSMKVHQEPDGQVTQARKNDSRLTPIGGFLRRTSLDELPQFINVLQGRMSVVGPRPHALEHNLHYKELIPRYMQRHKVKPGITGLAQVSGFRGETETIEKMKARVDHDLIYLETWSVWLDLKIIFLTVFRVMFDRNAY